MSRPADLPTALRLGARARAATRWTLSMPKSERNTITGRYAPEQPQEPFARHPAHRADRRYRGVGFGQSTLVKHMLYAALRKSKGKSTDAPGAHRALRRQDLVDQSPIGKTTRLNRARYVGTLDAILKLYAQQPLAKECKYSANVSNVGETCHSKATTLPAAMADLCGLVLRQVWKCSGRSEDDGFAATPCGSSWPVSA